MKQKKLRMTQERTRLQEACKGTSNWKKWGLFLSDRQWGTVREDHSENGNARDYFTHDQARSRAYHWGEDGLAGISDDKKLLCFSVVLWNDRDPILKERLFGLTNSEGNVLIFRDGKWKHCECNGWLDNPSFPNLLAWS